MPKRHPRPYTEEEFKKLYYSGMTITEISDFFKISRIKVQRDMNRFRVKSRRAIPRNCNGENNPSWKGENATYSAFHIRKIKLDGSPKKCEVCGTKDENKIYQWASLTKK